MKFVNGYMDVRPQGFIRRIIPCLILLFKGVVYFRMAQIHYYGYKPAAGKGEQG